MEKLINPLQGEFGTSHVRSGVLVRKKSGQLVGIVVQSSRGYAIRSPFDEYFGGEQTLNMLMVRFSNVYQFFLL